MRLGGTATGVGGGRIKQLARSREARVRVGTRRSTLARPESDFLAAIVDTVAALVVVFDPEGRIVRFNRACEIATGYRADEVLGTHVWDLLVPPDQVARVRAWFDDPRAAGVPSSLEDPWLTRDGGRRLIAWSNTALRRGDTVEYVIGTGIDITDQRRTEEAMRAIEIVGDTLASEGPTPEALSEVVDQLAGRFGYGLVSVYLSESGRLQLVGQTGYDNPIETFDGTSGVIGRAMRTQRAEFLPDVTLDPDYISLDPMIRSEICVPLVHGSELLGIVNVERAAPDPPLDEHDLRLLQSIADRVASAVALGRKRVELEDQAFHDALTGLPNRALFTDRTDHAIAVRARNGGLPVAVVFLDLDDFKAVNDGLGHAAGDELLRLVGERLDGAARSTDTVARLGGDEFALLLEDVPTVETAFEAAERIVASLEGTFTVAGRPMVIGCSAGMAIGSSSAADLLRDADVALYRSKRTGKSRLVAFQPHMRDAAMARLDLEREIRAAARNGEFVLVYQPTVDLATGRTVAVEALVRWRHRVRGLLTPDEFLAAAEETGIFLSIGRFVLRQACRQAQAWMESGRRLMPVSVNLTARQVADPGLVDEVRSAVTDAAIPAEWLRLEVTEGALVGNGGHAVETLQQLRGLGVKVALDNFGIGYSSLASIRELPVDILKVDRSFITGIDGAADRAAIVETVLRLGRVLGLTTVAQGVETESELATLRSLGADQAQGFLFSPPLAAGALEPYVFGKLAVAG